MKQNKAGITLIALVVTIVVLVILAAVSINVLLGDNGIIQKAKEAGQETRLATIKEEVIIAWGAVQAQSNTSQDEWFDEAAALQEELRKQDPEATVDWNDVGLDVFYKDMNFLLDYEGNLQNKIDWKAISWKDIQGEVEYGSMFGLDQNGKVYSIQIEENGKGNCFCISDMNSTVLYQRKIKEIAFNKRTVMVLDFDGKVYTWGSNNTGQIGNGTNGEPVLEPICISDLEGNALKGEKIVSIGCDESEATRTRASDEKSMLFVIDEDGKAYSWGYNNSGQLGIGTDQEISNIPVCLNEVIGSPLQGKKITKMKCNDSFKCIALDEEGKVYTWGRNDGGQLGDGTDKEYSNMPICISNIEQGPLKGKVITQIGDCMVVDQQGKVYTWGSNWEGRLGDGTDKMFSNLPICISDIQQSTLNGKKIIQIDGGDESGYSYAIDEKGKVYSWGDNSIGQLGDNTCISKNMPVCISDIEGNILQGKQICQVVARYETAILLDTQGKVYQMKEGSSCETENSARSFYKKKVNKIKSLISYKHFVLFGEEGSYIEYFT